MKKDTRAANPFRLERHRIELATAVVVVYFPEQLNYRPTIGACMDTWNIELSELGETIPF